MKTINTDKWIWEPIITVEVFRHKRTGEISYDWKLSDNFNESQLSNMLTKTIVQMSNESKEIERSSKRLMDIRDLIQR